MDSDKFNEVEAYVPNSCPHFEPERREIMRQLKKHNISVGDLHEALEGSVSESYLSKCLEEKNPRIKPCVIMKIREAMVDIINHQWVEKLMPTKKCTHE
jgi:hypothetical protein